MNTFNNCMPKDMLTLEIKVREDVRHMMKAMFISSEEKRNMLEKALELSLNEFEIHKCVEKYATQAINEAVKEYFTFGEGGQALQSAIKTVLSEAIPKIFRSDK